MSLHVSARQVQLDTVGRPDSYAGAEEISVFHPNRTAYRHGAGQHRPIVGITNGDSLEGLLLLPCVRLKIDGLNHRLQTIENLDCGRAADAALCQQRRQVFSGIGISCIRRKEFDRGRVLNKNFPHSLPNTAQIRMLASRTIALLLMPLLFLAFCGGLPVCGLL